MKENHNIDDEWKSFYIEKLFDHHFHCYRHDKQIIKYLIKWSNYRLKFNKWYEKDFLDSIIKLMLKYEICQNSNSNHISYLHKLLITDKTEFSAVSTNLSLKKQHCKSKSMTWYLFDIHVLNEACDFSAVRMQLCSLILLTDLIWSAVWYHLQFDIMCSLILSTLIHFIFLIQLQLCIY